MYLVCFWNCTLAYEPTKFQENNEEESKNEQKDETEVKADVEAAAEKPADVAEVKPDEVEEKPSVNEKVKQSSQTVKSTASISLRPITVDCMDINVSNYFVLKNTASNSSADVIGKVCSKVSEKKSDDKDVSVMKKAFCHRNTHEEVVIINDPSSGQKKVYVSDSTKNGENILYCTTPSRDCDPQPMTSERSPNGSFFEEKLTVKVTAW